MTLRWAEQGMAAAVWWVAGIGSLFFTIPGQLFVIYMLATFFGIILFGIYAMLRERRRTSPIGSWDELYRGLKRVLKKVAVVFFGVAARFSAR